LRWKDNWKFFKIPKFSVFWFMRIYFDIKKGFIEIIFSIIFRPFFSLVLSTYFMGILFMLRDLYRYVISIFK
jgi:hypothetical protein